MLSENADKENNAQHWDNCFVAVCLRSSSLVTDFVTWQAVTQRLLSSLVAS